MPLAMAKAECRSTMRSVEPVAVRVVSESHQEAVALVGRVGHEGAQHAKALDTLLSMKTRAGYSPESVSADQRMRAGRAARQLVDALRI